VNVDLDSVDDDGTAPEEEEKLPGEEEQSIPIRPVIPFDDLDLTLISDSVMACAIRMSVIVPLDYEGSETTVPIARSAHNPVGCIRPSSASGSWLVCISQIGKSLGTTAS
jgi:hypothetical protein